MEPRSTFYQRMASATLYQNMNIFEKLQFHLNMQSKASP